MSQQWQQVKEILQSALECPPGERELFLDHACGDDNSLRQQVETLLASSDNIGSFMEQAAIGDVAEMFAALESQLKIGESFDHYKIIKKIGAGGMGEVYLAQDTKLDRKVAIKCLNEECGRDADKLNRFIREAKAASALNHPNILTVYAICESGDTNYIVTEYIEGKTLREHLMRKETLPLNTILKIGVQTAEALSAAHQAGIIHRDIKPENIMLRRRDSIVKVLDFGLAKLIEQPAAGVDTEAATKPLFKTDRGVVLGTAV